MNLSLVKELGDRAAQGRAFGNLGNTHYLLGNFVEAIKFHREVKPSLRQTTLSVTETGISQGFAFQSNTQSLLVVSSVFLLQRNLATRQRSGERTVT